VLFVMEDTEVVRPRRWCAEVMVFDLSRAFRPLFKTFMMNSIHNNSLGRRYLKTQEFGGLLAQYMPLAKNKPHIQNINSAHRSHSQTNN
jgi:hypothetical protein